MSAEQIFILAVAGIAVLAAVAIFAVAFRRSGSDRDEGLGQPPAPQEARVLETVGAPSAAAGTTEVVETDEPAPDADVGPVPDPLDQRPQVSEEEHGVTRRQFFNRAVLVVFGVFLAQFAIGALAFMWPKLRSGGFGGKIDAGDATDLYDSVIQPDGTIIPVFVPSAQAYIIPFDAEMISGSSFEQTPVPVVAGDLMALWQRCVHLGCRVPTCIPAQGFECPCHGSKYNMHGEYEGGPAPRNLDRFAVEINDANRFIVDTGSIVQTARAKNKTIAYPQGPSCLSGTDEEH